ncbi:class I SAM-dependent methyltransferase [Chitinophaga defluvii]|uniref:Class I SAM-dependent methyltransferase n=1 Tax=Chitinophaga defluvii TaxID=3163343 RepID=A0ABV2T4Y1_9BACT
MNVNSTGRFSNRVADYVKYRPGYPEAVMPYLQEITGLPAGGMVADIGSGTGISSRLFLDNGYQVCGVEPNKEMREKAEELLKTYPGFTSVNGTAEASTLESASADLIVAGQAFHWFDRIKTKVEWSRIARPGAYAVVLFNERQIVSPFEKAYEELLLQYATDYTQINHRNVADADLFAFYAPAPGQVKTFHNEQVFDFDGVKGRMLSSSYVPTASSPVYEEMLSRLQQIFEQHQVNGKVKFDYETKVYTGMLR